MNLDRGGFAGMLKLGVVLALYAAVACVGLAFVYAGTKDIITQRQQEDQARALLELFPDADSFEAVQGIRSGDPMVVFEEGGAFQVLRHGQTVGLAISTSRAAYGGAIKTLVGVGMDNRISGVKILEHSETPGLGANAAKPAFYGQFAGMAAGAPFVPKQDVAAITAATITSQAVSSSVKAAAEAASAWLGGSR